MGRSTAEVGQGLQSRVVPGGGFPGEASGEGLHKGARAVLLVAIERGGGKQSERLEATCMENDSAS